MKKVLLLICCIGIAENLSAMDTILYQDNDVIITQQDADDFRAGTLTQERFDELHATIAKLVPELQDKSHGNYRMAMTWMPELVSEYTDKMLAKLAELKAQGHRQMQRPTVSENTRPSSVPAKAVAPQRPALKPTLQPQQGLVYDAKYLLGITGVVVVLAYAYKWYTAEPKNTKNKHASKSAQ